MEAKIQGIGHGRYTVAAFCRTTDGVRHKKSQNSVIGIRCERLLRALCDTTPPRIIALCDTKPPRELSERKHSRRDSVTVWGDGLG